MRALGSTALSALVVFVVLQSSPVMADSKPAKCVVTILKIELKDSTGRWVTAYEGKAQTDLVNQDNPALEFQNVGRIPAGDYTNFRVTMSETVSVTGSVNEHQTRGGGRAVVTGTAAKGGLQSRILSYTAQRPTATAEPAGPILLTLNFDQGDRDNFIELYGKRQLKNRLKVKSQSKLRLWMDFDLTGTLRYAFPDMLGPGIPAEDAMLFEVPAPREASMQADGVSSGFAADDLTLDY